MYNILALLSISFVSELVDHTVHHQLPFFVLTIKGVVIILFGSLVPLAPDLILWSYN